MKIEPPKIFSEKKYLSPLGKYKPLFFYRNEEKIEKLIKRKIESGEDGIDLIKLNYGEDYWKKRLSSI